MIPTQYPVSHNTPHMQLRTLPSNSFPCLSIFKDVHCPVSTQPPFRCHEHQSRKRHALAFTFNLAMHILHLLFFSFKVNKNKFQDFLRSHLFSHESAEMSNSHTCDESLAVPPSCPERENLSLSTSGRCPAVFRPLVGNHHALAPGVHNGIRWTHGHLSLFLPWRSVRCYGSS